jgi:nicotinamidase-related amidase
MSVLSANDLRLDRNRSALLIVDVQERLATVMAPGDLATCLTNILILVEAARRLQLPVVVSEQYPQGLGLTVPLVRAALAEPGLEPLRIAKLTFSCTDDPGFMEIFRRLRREQWIVAGMEAHICVYQTARGLVAEGAKVHVPADAVIARAPSNVHRGLALTERAGAIITGTEAVLFDLLGRAGTDDFRALSKLVK